jgi:hypothetical protein
MMSTMPAPHSSEHAPKPCHSFLARHQFSVQEDESTTNLHQEEPSDTDVVCGRGKGSYNRPGNKRFRVIALQYVPKYTAAKTRLDKSMVLNTIMEEVQRHGRFVKYESKKMGWYEISDELAREKVGHAIREAMAALEHRGSPEEGQMCFTHKQSDLLAQQRELFLRLLKSSGSYSAVAVSLGVSL